MSDHVRKQIRLDALERLESAIGLKTFKGPRSLDELDLPAGGVLADEETGTVISTSRTKERSLEVTLLVVLQGDPDRLEDDLDDYAARIEAEFDSTPPTGAKRFELTATSIELMSDEEGDRWYGTLALVYQATYFTKQGAPTVSA